MRAMRARRRAPALLRDEHAELLGPRVIGSLHAERGVCVALGEVRERASMPTGGKLGVVLRGPGDPQQVILGEGVYVQRYRGLDGPVIELGGRGRVVRHRLCR